MLGFLKALILLPIAIVVVLLAVANRAPVLLSFDPFSRGAPELSLTLPLFVFLFAAVALGVLAGGVGAWLTGGKHRRARRLSNRELTRLKSEADRLRATLSARTPAPGTASAPGTALAIPARSI